MNKDVYSKRLAWAQKEIAHRKKERINAKRRLVLLQPAKGAALPKAKWSPGKDK